MSDSKHIDRVTLLLVALSAGLLQVALDDRQPGVGVPLLAVSAAIALALRFALIRKADKNWNALAVGAIALLGLLPMIWDFVSRAWFWRGEPFEVQWTCSLRNMMLGLAAAQQLPRARGLAVLSSLVMVVVGFLWATNPWTIGLMVVYAAVGMWWLVGTYWDRLGGRFADETEASVPIRPSLLAGVLIALVSVAFAPLAMRSSSTTALHGFMPSSGGTGRSDPFAHGGVGDGDQMVAAEENASSFGPVESELFLESKMPSLYDSFNELSETAPEKRKQARRAIPLAPSMTQTNHQKRGITQKATREFSTVRQRTKRRPTPKDQKSPALLLVSGRTPMHLGLETYDRWDGRSLLAAQDPEPLRLELLEKDRRGLRWLGLSVSPPAKIFTAQAETQVRVVNLRTEAAPTPPNTTAVTIDGLHAANMFSATSDGTLAMQVDHIPQLTILRMRSALRERHTEPALETIDLGGVSPVLEEIAAEWTVGVSRGWPQVRAVLGRLRRDYVHDPETMVPASAGDAVEHFLVRSKRGPDYLFAASAATLLRSLGYETRVRSGFYASPERYDPISRLTTIFAADAHFWVEVKSSQGTRVAANGDEIGGVWVAIEPTPGYELLYAPETWLGYLRRQGWQAWRVAAAHPVAAILLCLALGILVVRRRSIVDAALVGVWPVGARLVGPRRLTRFTLHLLEWRAWMYGRDRPAGAPLGRWDALNGHGDFLSAVSWALYGEQTKAPLCRRTVREACRRASRADLRPAASSSFPLHEIDPSAATNDHRR